MISAPIGAATRQEGSRERSTRIRLSLAFAVMLAIPGFSPAATDGSGAKVPAEPPAEATFDLAAQLDSLNSGRREGELDGSHFGTRQRELMDKAARIDPRAAAQTILLNPERVMVGDWWLINVQALFREWGRTDLSAMTEWVGKHRLHPKLQPAADYALFQHRVAGLGSDDALALWRRLPDATRHWAKRDVASIVARSDPGTGLERLARLFPAGERGEMMSLALDVVARKHPRTLLPWLEDLAPFFYTEPGAWEALYLLPAEEIRGELAKLTENARAQISLEYLRHCLSRGDVERARNLMAGVVVEPYKTLMEADLKSAMAAAGASEK